ncbi:peptidoglycan DD-metalloendopeptidase family protein [Clostridium chromiireducens]|uniref:Peptidoglycan DD-metalloendopeptidase family protein n=1 Tax=Clostridium chromiireducens TaxID=225345 RepID=A0A964RLN4_9CLOT|nr:M23 family metallopeptidase [Clostridium chromiireducens]MVX63872.1 peptidoglycan DD-metalloendopeptidase family protein [Clostridium chromiireducens]
MNKNLKEKFRNLIRKEGFYIALFLCLCIIVTVGTISYKMLSNRSEVNKTEEINKELTLNSDDSGKTVNEVQNAERVDNSSSNKNTTDKTKTEKAATVATNNTVSFVNPLDGVESRKYTYPAPVKVEEGIFRTIRGVNLEAKIGTDVKAAADGVVELVDNSGVEEGVVVEIKHANGLRTRYGNLDANVLVKKGSKVTANQVIAKVGETAKVFSKDAFGEFLNLQVIDANGEQVNPEKYFKLKSK